MSIKHSVINVQKRNIANTHSPPNKPKSMSILANHFLIPTSAMDDAYFSGALVYICRHSKDGAWGFVVNKPLEKTSIGALLQDLNMPITTHLMHTPAMDGGRVHPEAGFVLHTGQDVSNNAFLLGENICLSTNKDALRAISGGVYGHYLVMMGYCHWLKNQLMDEINAGIWLTVPACAQILFCDEHAQKLSLAHQALGFGDAAPTPIGSA